jgi:uncharacterized glyoxalase superfamily protein PhnB
MLLDAVPILPVRSADSAMTFYRDRLGFDLRYREGGLAIVECDGVALHLTQLDDERWKTRADFTERPIKSGAESFIPGTASCRIRVDDAARLFADLSTAGALRPNAQLHDRWWGDRDFGVVDPDGNLLTFFQRNAVPRSTPDPTD